MGSILRGLCKCGFDTGDIYVGAGFVNFMETCNAPAICLHCNEFLVRNYLKKETTVCPGCHGKVTFYDDPSLSAPHPHVEGDGCLFTWKLANRDGHFKLPRADFLCPKCKKTTLVFEDLGSWS